MIRLTYANRTEALVDAFVEQVREQRARVSPLVPIHIVVPGRHVERFLEVRCAEAMGVTANFRFHRLEAFVSRWLHQTNGSRPLNRRAYEAGALATLLDEGVLREPDFEPLVHYLEAAHGQDAQDAGRAQLAMRIAALFEGYSLSRPELLADWSAGRLGTSSHASGNQQADARWQRALFAEVLRRTERRPLSVHLRALSDKPGAGLPTRVHVFGLSYVARVYGWVFAAIGQRTELSLYTLNPCMEFWEDVPSDGELRQGGSIVDLPRRGSLTGQDDQEEHPLIARSGDPPALTYWGRPGREHVLLLNELTGADFEPRFVDPRDQSVLARLQRDILQRSPADGTKSSDRSIVAVECPSVRRELEVCAESIWSAVRADPTLRFNDIAVFVPAADRAIYLPHLTSVFEEAQNLPHHVVDLPLATESRLVEAAQLLVDLPLTSMRRPDLLEVLVHPSTRGAEHAEAWSALIDRLGVFHGLDRTDHEGTYIDKDLLSWDQGVRRLSLGAFMDSDVPLMIGDEHYYPAAFEADDHATWLAALIRSLCADVRFARDTRMPLSEWSVFFAGLFRGYLCPNGSREESELRRCLRAADSIREGGLEEPVGYRLASELLRATLSRLGGARGEYLADGVVVSALAPMRAIPFRHIFVLGLGEGRFPTTERRDPLDLRAMRRMLGDVTPSERDKYVFLESLLCARDAFHVSWVAREPLTGDAIPPSPVVAQLLEMLSRDYLTPDAQIRSKASLRRHEDAAGDAAIRESVAEAEAAAAHSEGDDLRASPELRRLLALTPLPSGKREPVKELSLAALRYFLESPAQGWARSVLQLDRAREEARSGQTDEPLRAERLERAETLRRAFEGALTERCSPMPFYDAEAERLASTGRWPIGVLAKKARAEDERTLGAWQRAYKNAISIHTAPERVRFGDARERGEASRLLAPLEVQVQLGGGETQTVRIVGRTEALIEEGASSLLLVAREAPPGGKLQRERYRYGLRAYLDALALAASEPPDSVRSHRGLILFAGDSAREASVRFAPTSRAAALGILGKLVGALLSREHAYYLPSSAVFRVAKSWPSATADQLAQAIEVVRREDAHGYGPLRDEVSLAALPPIESFALALDRFNPFFESIGVGRAGP